MHHLDTYDRSSSYEHISPKHLEAMERGSTHSPTTPLMEEGGLDEGSEPPAMSEKGELHTVAK